MDDSAVKTAFVLRKNDIIVSNTNRYLIMDFLGAGSFGKVAKCLNLTTCKTEAVKIHTSSKENIILREVEMLQAVRGLDPEKHNIVRFKESFRFNDLSCLAFERLDKSLFDLMRERRFLPLSLNEIRPVIRQLVVAFDALKDIGVLHTDLKPDNIMLVNHNDQPFKVKLIDFGLACPVSQLKVGMAMQAPAYRAPEVVLGLPLSEAVDMWGLGCVAAFLYFGMSLFPGNCEYHWMKTVVQLLGQPEDHLLGGGTRSWQYFCEQDNCSSPGWRMKSPEEYRKDTGVTPIVAHRFGGKNLEDVVQGGSKKSEPLAHEDLLAFSSLLKSLLHVDPAKRITPEQALKHPFLTMTHLANERDTNPYAGEAHKLMAVCRAQCLDGTGDCLTRCQTDAESDSRAFRTVSLRDSSSASICENDSLPESFTCYDGDVEDISDESSDLDSYTARPSGTRCPSGYDTGTESEPVSTGPRERHFFFVKQRDSSPASLWEEDEFTENCSYGKEATERGVVFETQREPSPASLWEDDETTGPHVTNISVIVEPRKTFQVQRNDILHSNSTSYKVIDFVGEGCFGKVARCVDLTTGKSAAVKIHTGNDEFVIQCEVEMLEAIRALDPEKCNITRFLESFRFNGLSCLAFEMLDRSLFDLMIERNLMPMRLNEIRPVIHQLLVAFDALKDINMVHTDLKPDNIMLVNHKAQPYRVKLIDFGLARPVRELVIGDIVQAITYRAPEVLLGLRLSEAIDMWGVGCVMAFLCFGEALCFSHCEYEMMKFIVQARGLPTDHMLRAGMYSEHFFSKVEGAGGTRWRLNSPEEYEEATGIRPQLYCNFFDKFRDLEEAVRLSQRCDGVLENEDAMAFLSLLKSCLHLDPTKRLTPKQALKHPFITMTHLANERHANLYACEAHHRMALD